MSGSLVAARVRGLCTVLVTKSGAAEDCQSWRIQSSCQSRTVSGVTLGYCDADSLQKLRLLLAFVPARTTVTKTTAAVPVHTASSFSRSSSKYGLTKVEWNSKPMPPSSLQATKTNLSGEFIDATGPSYLLCKLTCLGFGHVCQWQRTARASCCVRDFPRGRG